MNDEQPQSRVILLLRQSRPFVLGLIALGLAYFAYLAISTPMTTTVPSVSQTFSQEVTFDYYGVTRPSILYPETKTLGIQRRYPTRMLSDFRVKVKALSKAAPGVSVVGTHSVLLRLDAGGYWVKDYVLSPETSFSGVGQVTVLDTELSIPLGAIVALIEQVGKELGVLPTHKLTVIPVIKAKTQDAQEPLAAEFSPYFSFDLSLLEVIARGKAGPNVSVADYDISKDLRQEISTSTHNSDVIYNSIWFAGNPIPVREARTLFTLGAMAFGLPVLSLIVRSYRRRPLRCEADKLLHRHKKRLAVADSDDFAAGAKLVAINTFTELLTLADERERSLICVDKDDYGHRCCRFFLPDEKVLYYYTASTEIQSVASASREESLIRWVHSKPGTML